MAAVNLAILLALLGLPALDGSTLTSFIFSAAAIPLSITIGTISEAYATSGSLKYGHYKTKLADKLMNYLFGEQLVTAEVKALGEFLQLQVRAVEILRIDDFKKAATPFSVGDNVKRKKTTIARGSCDRLVWSDEGARAAVISGQVK